MTQARLAQAVGVSPKAVSKWETGGGAPDLSLLPALSQALGVEMGLPAHRGSAGQRPGPGKYEAHPIFCLP